MAQPTAQRYKALFDYNARNDGEITFKKDQIVYLYSIEPDGWASGECLGSTGWFPSSYVTPDSVLNEIASAPAEKVGRNVDTRSVLLNKEEVTAQLERWVDERPDVAFLEKNKIVSAGALPSDPRKKPSAAALPTGKAEPVKKEKKGWFGKKKEGVSSYAAASPLTGKKGSAVSSGSGSAISGSGGYFGVQLAAIPEIVAGTHEIPVLITRFVELLRGCALDLQGIFRISGLASDIDSLKRQFQSGDTTGPLASTDPHAVSGALKKFFRDLPDPLFTHEMHTQWVSSVKLDGAAMVAQLRQLVAALPQPNQAIVRYMLPFLRLVSSHSGNNMMTPDNLGIVFGPTLLRSADETRGMVDTTNRSQNLIALLVEKCAEVFDVDVPSSPSATQAPRSPRGGAASGGSGVAEPQRPVIPSTPAPQSKVPLGGGAAVAPGLRRPVGGGVGLPAPKGMVKAAGTSAALASSGSDSSEPDATTSAPASPAAGSPAPKGSAPRAMPTPVIKGQGVVPARKPAGAAAAPGAASATTPGAAAAAASPAVKPAAAKAASGAIRPAAAKAAAAKLPPPPEDGKPELARALYDYTGDSSKGQLTFPKDAMILVLQRHESGWWTCEHEAVRGYAPSTYVQLLDD